MKKAPDPCIYRILTANYRIKYAGTDLPSWHTLAKARELVNYEAGEMIYEYYMGERLHEIF